MIGKSLNDRYGVRALMAADVATKLLEEILPAQAEFIVGVRARGADMIACVFVRADEPSVRMCRTFGFELKPGGTAVLGLAGSGAAAAFPELPAAHRAWLLTPCTARETKVIVVAEGGVGLLSLETRDGKVTITAFVTRPD